MVLLEVKLPKRPNINITVCSHENYEGCCYPKRVRSPRIGILCIISSSSNSNVIYSVWSAKLSSYNIQQCHVYVVFSNSLEALVRT